MPASDLNPDAPAPAAPPPLLQVTALGFAYPGQPPLFDRLDFALPPGLARIDGEVGKTTLLRLLAGALTPQAGRFSLHGRPWLPAAEPAAVCWIDPRDPAWDGLPPEAVADAVRRRHPGFDDAAWARHVAGFGLDEHAGKTMHMLSTGSRRKVTLAAALAAGAALTLLDEPTAGLDRPAIAWLVQALADEAEVARRAAPGSGRAWVLAAAWGLEDRLPWAATIGW